ncbi:hypothetical protein J1605_015057 [Eschrichtius robustus]|uniref:Uncharacterized protein n=1 Tax=Eschrichtius robustus TaxID=9764 RepID=A0AB34GEA8_ESCRO|nr:hypothetical protein J1605_015057 [Eschrichtius robustus]
MVSPTSPSSSLGLQAREAGQWQSLGPLSQSSPTMDSAYKMGHICKLRAQHIQMQEKTFTKRINNIFQHGRMGIKIQNLYTELAVGTHLLWLLEPISGEVLLPPNQDHMRIHFLENSSRALAFLRAKVDTGERASGRGAGVGSGDRLDD